MCPAIFMHTARKVLPVVVLAAAAWGGGVSVAAANGPQCAPRMIAQNIKDAVLALKATEYCVGFEFPYTIDDVNRRIEDLRCGNDSSQLLDELINDYNLEYKTILTADHQHTVCKQAQTIVLYREKAAKNL